MKRSRAARYAPVCSISTLVAMASNLKIQDKGFLESRLCQGIPTPMLQPIMPSSRTWVLGFCAEDRYNSQSPLLGKDLVWIHPFWQTNHLDKSIGAQAH